MPIVMGTRIFGYHTCFMKTKLTLTVRKSVIDHAKRYSRRTGKSISQLFEDFFDSGQASVKSEPQRAAERLLRRLKAAKPVKPLKDKELLNKHVAGKYS